MISKCSQGFLKHSYTQTQVKVVWVRFDCSVCFFAFNSLLLLSQILLPPSSFSTFFSISFCCCCYICLLHLVCSLFLAINQEWWLPSFTHLPSPPHLPSLSECQRLCAAAPNQRKQKITHTHSFCWRSMSEGCVGRGPGVKRGGPEAHRTAPHHQLCRTPHF